MVFILLGSGMRGIPTLSKSADFQKNICMYYERLGKFTAADFYPICLKCLNKETITLMSTKIYFLLEPPNEDT